MEMVVLFVVLAQGEWPGPYLDLFRTTLDTITIVIAVGVAVVSIMSVLGYRSVNVLRERLERDIRDLRTEARHDAQRLQDQVDNRIAKIDSLIEKFDKESANKLRELEETGGTIRETTASAQKLLSEIQEASTKGEKLIADMEAKYKARIDALIAKGTEGKQITAEEKEILATREAEIAGKEASERTADEWLSLAAGRFSKGDYTDAVRYGEIALEKGVKEVSRYNTSDLIGTSYRYLGQYEKALRNFERTYEIAHQRRDISKLANALNSRSKMHAFLGQYDAALQLNSEAMEYLKLPDTYHYQEVIYYNKALIHKLRGTDQDRRAYETAIEKLKSYSLGPELMDLMARDATEFDLKAHPQLGDLFEFCKTLPRKKLLLEYPGVELIETPKARQLSQVPRRSRQGRRR